LIIKLLYLKKEEGIYSNVVLVNISHTSNLHAAPILPLIPHLSPLPLAEKSRDSQRIMRAGSRTKEGNRSFINSKQETRRGKYRGYPGPIDFLNIIYNFLFKKIDNPSVDKLPESIATFPSQSSFKKEVLILLEIPIRKMLMHHSFLMIYCYCS
jgi:hypothetical protein